MRGKEHLFNGLFLVVQIAAFYRTISTWKTRVREGLLQLQLWVALTCNKQASESGKHQAHHPTLLPKMR